MIQEFTEFATDAILKIGNEELLQNYDSSKAASLFTLIRTQETQAIIQVDDQTITIQKNTLIVLTPNQYMSFIEGNDLVVYQFNREFYCIKDHDKEVSCMGLLFYGNNTIPILTLDQENIQKLDNLHDIFVEELATVDTIQAEMLRMLTARLIITATRLMKQQTDFVDVHDEQIDLLRNFNALVESHFRKEHSVSFYAEQLFKSPKTLSNNFAKFKQSPLQIIHNRIILEAKRLLHYTDKTAKEIAYEIGFEDASHLSRMFKKHTAVSPSEFRKRLKLEPSVQ